MPGYFTNARTVVLGGSNHERTIRILREYTENLEFADPLLRLDLPALLDLNPLLGLAADLGLVAAAPAARSVQGRDQGPGPGARAHLLARKAARDSDVVVATYDELDAASASRTSPARPSSPRPISDERLAELGGRGVDMVLDSTPQPFDVTVTAAVLEAMMLRDRRPAG